MIKFFRHVRKDLIGKNKTGKYLKYAIGEIILVVIGILMALSINNWNDERKSLERQKDLLTQMKNNLEDNLVQFSRVEKVYRDKRESIKIVLNHIRNKEILPDSICNHFYGPFRDYPPNLTLSAYETFKSSGLGIIKSDKLREEIINLYEVFYTEYTENIELGLNLWEAEVIATYYSQNFSVINDQFITPNNYEFLFSDQKFINILTHRRTYFASIISTLRRMQKLTKNLIIELESYLEVE